MIKVITLYIYVDHKFRININSNSVELKCSAPGILNVELHVLTITLYSDHKYNSNTDSNSLRAKMETLHS